MQQLDICKMNATRSEIKNQSGQLNEQAELKQSLFCCIPMGTSYTSLGVKWQFNCYVFMQIHYTVCDNGSEILQEA